MAILAFSGAPSAIAILLDMTEIPSILPQKSLCKKNSLTLLPRIALDVEFGEFKIDAPQSTIDEYHGDANLYAESIAKAYRRRYSL